MSIKEVIKYFGDSGQLKNRYIYLNCDWCKDEFLPWIDDQYNIARRAVDDTGIVQHWRLRSPGANVRLVAGVSGFCGDGFDQGSLGVSGGGGDLSLDGHFIFDGSDVLTAKDNDSNVNGLRSALWQSDL